MAPQTRSTAKAFPGRLTRNSVYGRPPLPSASPRKSTTNASPAKTAPARDEEIEGKATSDVSGTKGIPWLACRDTYGILTTISVSETGEGVHVRWHYPDECEADEDADADLEMAMTVNEERGVTPTASAGPSKAVRLQFPQTPMAPQPYDAGSVIQTPVKKAKRLQPSPPRIGNKGIRCLYEKGGLLGQLESGGRILFHHPVGSVLNLSREQVEHLENEREAKIVQVQVEKLLAISEKRRKEEGDERFSDSGYEDEMETDVPSSQRGLQSKGTNGAIYISRDDLSDLVLPVVLEEMESASGIFRGPNGEPLDGHGRQMLGREGTILIDATSAFPGRIMRGEAFPVSTNIEHYSSRELHHRASKANGPGLRRPRFGPEGTELID